MTDKKNTMVVTYGVPGVGDEFGKHYRSGRHLRCWVNGNEITGMVNFQYEVGVNDIMNVTIQFLVAEMEVKGNDADSKN